MWAATFGDRENMPDGKLRVFINFTNGSDAIRREFICDGVSGMDGLKSSVQSAINEFTRLDDLKTGVVSDKPVDLTPESPTQNQQARSVFSSNISKLKQYLSAIQLNILTSDDSGYNDILKTVKSTYQPEFIDLL